ATYSKCDVWSISSASKEGLAARRVGIGSCLMSTWLVGSHPELPEALQETSASSADAVSSRRTCDIDDGRATRPLLPILGLLPQCRSSDAQLAGRLDSTDSEEKAMSTLRSTAMRGASRAARATRNTWIERATRAGYIARGLLYGSMGTLALVALATPSGE